MRGIYAVLISEIGATTLVATDIHYVDHPQKMLEKITLSRSVVEQVCRFVRQYKKASNNSELILSEQDALKQYKDYMDDWESEAEEFDLMYVPLFLGIKPDSQSFHPNALNIPDSYTDPEELSEVLLSHYNFIDHIEEQNFKAAWEWQLQRCLPN